MFTVTLSTLDVFLTVSNIVKIAQTSPAESVSSDFPDSFRYTDFSKIEALGGRMSLRTNATYNSTS